MLFPLFGLALIAGSLTYGPHSAATPGRARPTVTQAVRTYEPLMFRGVASLRRRAATTGSQAAPNATGSSDAAVRQQKRGYFASDVHSGAKRASSSNVPSANIPAASGLPIVPPEISTFGFVGLTHADQRNAGSGAYTNTQFSLEPPDQALCVGNGLVVEAVNNAIAIYDSSGKIVSGPTPLSQFFGLAPEFQRPNGPYGPFLSDPRCRYDADTHTWFVTELEIDVDPRTGAFGRHSSTLVGVSRGSDPTGAYSIMSFDTTDMKNPGCPCFGDQPLIGADANGFYVSTNEFPISGPGFNGAQIYALSKAALAFGTLPTVVHFDAGKLATPDVGGVWYSVQPASAPAGGANDPSVGGTEYFLSALDFANLGNVGQYSDNRIAVWALTGTQSLAAKTPNVALQATTIGSQTYSQPPNATQMSPTTAGLTPLGTKLGAPLETLQTNDDRMQQVVFAAGRLWAGLNTAVRVGGTTVAGIATFSIAPNVDATGLPHASVASGGYLAVRGQNLMYPSIGVSASGTAVAGFSLSGPDYFPSAAYVRAGTDEVFLANAGTAPEDGFTGYAAYGGNGAARWGDYSAAVADADGSVWFSAEQAIFTPRSTLANWATYVGHVR